jgi:hypothetical protein
MERHGLSQMVQHLWGRHDRSGSIETSQLSGTQHTDGSDTLTARFVHGPYELADPDFATPTSLHPVDSENGRVPGGHNDRS